MAARGRREGGERAARGRREDGGKGRKSYLWFQAELLRTSLCSRASTN
jgi:hypothetical protein